MKKLIVAILSGLLVLAGCGSANDTKPADSQQPAGEEVKQLSDSEIIRELNDINNWYVGDIWNDGICNIRWYVELGTSSTGEELDIEMTLKRYNEAVAKLEEYNDFVSGLSDDKYEDVKYAWDKLYNQIKVCDEIIQNNEIKAKSNLDLKSDLLTQYSDAFSDYVFELNE